MGITDAILLGAGLGTRFSQSEKSTSQLPKQFQVIAGVPVFIWGLRRLINNLKLRHLVVVVPPGFRELARELARKHLSQNQFSHLEFIEGGTRRQDSSEKALFHLSTINPVPDRVIIHDACRPFISDQMLHELQTHLTIQTPQAWIPVIPVVETLKKVQKERVVETIDRSLFYRVQTPQLFNFSEIFSLFQKLEKTSGKDFTFTDDASVLEYFKVPVGTFPGDERNIKLTYQFELDILQHNLLSETREASCD